MHLTTLLTGAIAAAGVMAHPGDDPSHEIAERREYLKHNRRDLSHCTEKMKRNGLARRSAERRAKRALDLTAAKAPHAYAKQSTFLPALHPATLGALVLYETG